MVISMKKFLCGILFLILCFMMICPVQARQVSTERYIGGTISEDANVNEPYNKPSVSDYASNYHREDDFNHNCLDFVKTIRMGGYLVLFVKIVIPLIIIVKSTINLISTVTKGSQDELKKKAQQVGISLVAGIAIFMIPTLLDAIWSLIPSYDEESNEDSKVCTTCIFKPLSKECDDYVIKSQKQLEEEMNKNN